MIYIPLKHLTPGMTVARSVNYTASRLPLITEGQTLTPEHLERLKRFNVSGVYVKSKLGDDDIQAEEFLDPKIKGQLTRDIEKVYRSYATQLTTGGDAAGSVSSIAENLLAYVLSSKECIMNVVEIKGYDTYTYSHCLYVGTLSVMIGVKLNLPRPDLLNLAIAGILHDLGKLDIPLNIINKPGSLTDEEFDLVKAHPMNAVVRLRPSKKFSEEVLEGIATHHERYDGTGYPRGLKGKEIHLYGRILAMADVYDALTSIRSYRAAWAPHDVIEYMMGCSNTHFDYDILKAFLKTIAAYPVGTIVQLSNGYLAVVIKNHVDNTLRPVVRLLQPEEEKGREMDLYNDHQYLNLTITGTLTDMASVPQSIFT